MADDIDDIKRDADIQRGKEAPENGEALTSEQEILQSIRDVLIQQTELVDGIESKNLVKVGEVLNNLLSVEQQQLEISKLMLEMALDEAELEDVSKLKDLEQSKKLINTFQGIEQSIETMNIHNEGDQKGGGFGLLKGFMISRLISQLGGGAGLAFAGLGIGIGLGIVMVSFAGAVQMIANVNADGVRDLIVALADGMAAFSTRDLAAIGVMFGGVAAISLVSLVSVPRAFGMAASMTMLGVGLSGFMLGLGSGAALMEWLNLDLKNLPHVAQKLSETAEVIGNSKAGFTGLASVVAIGGLFAITSGSGATLSRQALAAASMTMGMTAVGLGISGFFMGLGVGSAGLEFINSDWTGLPKAVNAMVQVSEKLAASEESLAILGGLTAVGGIFGVVAGTKLGAATAGKAALGATIGMGLVGAGIGAFFAGLGIGEGFLNIIGSDGSTMGSIMINIADGLRALENVNAGVLFGTMGIFATLGAVTGGALGTGAGAPVAAVTGLAMVGAATGMGMAGYALGAFFSGFAMVGQISAFLGADGSGLKKIMVNMGEGLEGLTQNVDGAQLAAVGGGLILLGPGLLAFFGTDGILGIVGKLKEWGSKGWNAIGNFLGFDMESGKKTGKKGMVELLVESLKPLEKLKVDGNVLMGLANVTDLMINFFNIGDMKQKEMDMIYYKNKWLIDQVVQRAQLLELIHGGGNLSDIETTGPFRFSDGAIVDTGIVLPNVHLKGFVNLEGTDEAVEELQKMLDVISFTPTMNTQNLQNPLIASGQTQMLTDLRTVISNNNARSVQVIAPNFGTAAGLANSGGPGS